MVAFEIVLLMLALFNNEKKQAGIVRNFVSSSKEV